MVMKPASLPEARRGTRERDSNVIIDRRRGRFALERSRGVSSHCPRPRAGRFCEGGDRRLAPRPIRHAGILPLALDRSPVSSPTPRVVVSRGHGPDGRRSALLVPGSASLLVLRRPFHSPISSSAPLLRDAGVGTAVFDPLALDPRSSGSRSTGRPRGSPLRSSGLGLTLLVSADRPARSRSKAKQLQRVIVAVVLAALVGPAVHARVLTRKPTSRDLGRGRDASGGHSNDSQGGCPRLARRPLPSRQPCPLRHPRDIPEHELLARTFSEITSDDVAPTLLPPRPIEGGPPPRALWLPDRERYIHARPSGVDPLNGSGRSTTARAG